MKVTFWGAAGGVTGSMHLVETGGRRYLLDCGLHQGRRSDADRKNRELPFAGSSIDAVVLSRADDSVQRSYYYLCELKRTAGVRGPQPLVFDVAKIPRPSSLAHTHAAIERLAEELGCDLKELPAAIETRNRRRALLARLAVVRATPRPPPGSGTAQLLRAADLLPPAEFDAALADWIETDFPER